MLLIKSDKSVISSYNINTLSSGREVIITKFIMRIPQVQLLKFSFSLKNHRASTLRKELQKERFFF